jgi:N-hydroxyarylamine O-acetyltransferase
VPLDGTPAGAHRIARTGSEIVLEQDGKPLWMSSFEHDIPIDFEMANHFTATHPASHFTRSIMMRAYTADGAVRIRNRDVTFVRGNETQTHQLADRAELRALVAKHFGFDLPAIDTLRVPNIPEWT